MQKSADWAEEGSFSSLLSVPDHGNNVCSLMYYSECHFLLSGVPINVTPWLVKISSMAGIFRVIFGSFITKTLIVYVPPRITQMDLPSCQFLQDFFFNFVSRKFSSLSHPEYAEYMCGIWESTAENDTTMLCCFCHWIFGQGMKNMIEYHSQYDEVCLWQGHLRQCYLFYNSNTTLFKSTWLPKTCFFGIVLTCYYCHWKLWVEIAKFYLHICPQISHLGENGRVCWVIDARNVTKNFDSKVGACCRNIDKTRGLFLWHPVYVCMPMFRRPIFLVRGKWKRIDNKLLGSLLIGQLLEHGPDDDLHS